MELKIQGIEVPTYKKDWPKAFAEMHEYIKEVMKYYKRIFRKNILKFNKFLSKACISTSKSFRLIPFKKRSLSLYNALEFFLFY